MAQHAARQREKEENIQREARRFYVGSALLSCMAFLFSGCSTGAGFPKADMNVAYPPTRFITGHHHKSGSASMGPVAPTGAVSAISGETDVDRHPAPSSMMRSAPERPAAIGGFSSGMEGQGVDVTPQAATPDTQVTYGQ